MKVMDKNLTVSLRTVASIINKPKDFKNKTFKSQC